MTLILSMSVGVMAAGGIYLLLRSQLVYTLFGIGLLGNAVNLAILTLGQAKPGAAPIISRGEETLSSFSVDPLPQALVLTAIVIGFGMLAYLSALLKTGRDTETFAEHSDLEEEEGQ